MKYSIALIVLLSSAAYAQQPDLAGKANAFLATLSPELQEKARYTLEDDERLNWHFVPTKRNGACFRDFNAAQRAAGLDLLKTSLSTQGYQKATAIVALETILKDVEKRGPDDNYRDPLNYYITIFGTPSADAPWGWRFEGHHVALNFCSINNNIESSTPSFLGSNPGIVRQGSERGKQVLKDETSLGFTLVNSLSDPQRKDAIIAAEALPEIVSSDKRKAAALDPRGLSYGSMTEQQKNILLKLLDLYVKNYELGFASKLMAKIKKAGIENLSFAWAGSLQPGVGHYYRIQGPMLLIEYDNTQNNANHVHTVVRDLTNDFGEDILREHYAREHSQH
ncbi:DUF3500 domain-containing protein [Chryseolinea lacunae]|uniref:DUF3500 domain-containing protein n=1 Tax=Chryseolinea lacunae TaxID=2801331 RepID=A0ABS1KQW6_9BACT|nr:DUF3500 domain-containing protein [Chryseolinea lacunae]MBL0741873.1 DUF3500 domain-containing protein [Chryseolinea lacunae]